MTWQASWREQHGMAYLSLCLCKKPSMSLLLPLYYVEQCGWDRLKEGGGRGSRKKKTRVDIHFGLGSNVWRTSSHLGREAGYRATLSLPLLVAAI